MRRISGIIAATAVVVSLGTQTLSEALEPPVISEEPPRSSVTSSLGATEILISVLALLLVWAAYDQNERANSS